MIRCALALRRRPETSGLVAQLRSNREGVDDAQLDALLATGDTWTIA